MDWSKSYKASWRVFRVNRKTWADAEAIPDIDGVDITRTADGDLLESGSIETTREIDADYYRLVMTAEQDGEIARVDVATLLFNVTDGEINYNRTAHTIDGHSVLYPASKTAILAGEYAPAGVNGAQYAAEMLGNAINAPIEIEGSFTLNENVVHEIGSTVLDAVWAVLKAGNFIMQIDGRGKVHIKPMPTEPSLVLDNNSMNLLSNNINYTSDISEVPNRYIVVEDDFMTIATNDDPGSEISTVARGYFVDEVDESATPVNGETYSEYADRMLREKSYMEDEREYEREYCPDVLIYDIVKASLDSLQGDLRVKSQSINCDHGITVEEKAIRSIDLWPTK